MGLNTTGQGDVNAYRLGRGKVYLASLSSGLPDTSGYRFLGNATEFNISSETEKLEHTSSTAGLKTVDKEVIVSQKMSLTLTLDEINFQNLALFFSGATATHTNPHNASTITNVQITSAVVEGRWYDLTQGADGTGERIYDIQSGQKPSFEADSTSGYGAPTALVEDDDYSLDLKMGRVFFIVGGTVDLSANPFVRYTLTANATAEANVDEVQALSQTAVTGALKFIGINAADNKETEYQFHQVSLAPEGDFALIGEEFSTIQLSGSVEQNTLADSVSSYVTIRDFKDS